MKRLLQTAQLFRRSAMTNQNHVRWLKDIQPSEHQLFGWKTIHLSEIKRNFAQEIHVPEGFAISSQSCLKVIHEAGVKLTDIFAQDAILAQVRENILQADLPGEIAGEIGLAYQQLEREFGTDVTVTVRSSSMNEIETIDISPYFEGYSRVQGIQSLLQSCKKCIASWFIPQNVAYLLDPQRDKILASIQVKRMIGGGTPVSGLVFTNAIETGHENILEVFSMFGIGGVSIVGDPDHFLLHKDTLKDGFRPLLHRHIGKKRHHLGFDRKSHVLSMQKQHGKALSLHEEEIFELGRNAIKLQEFFKKPMKIEFCRDSHDEQVYILAAKQMPKMPHLFTKDFLEWYILEDIGDDAQLIAHGKPMNERITFGPVSRLRKPTDAFTDNSILVCDSTDESWDDIMKRSKGIIAEVCPRYSHTHFQAKQLGIPLIEEANCLDMIFGPVTMDGGSGKIYSGEVPYIVKREDLTTLPRIRTKIMQTMDTWSDSLKNSFIPNDGVGLLRIERMIQTIGIHPLAFIYPEKLSQNDKQVLKMLSADYSSPQDMFVTRMSEYIAMICAAYYPKPVRMRFSDFSETGYQKLMGVGSFEVSELNPLLGWRGASRYINPKYIDAFALECRAVQRARDVLGMKNLSVIIPFARTALDVEAVIQILAKHKLTQSQDFKIFMLCELPTNILQADAFLDHVDGYIIETNDLISMILGIDKGNEIIADIYHEKNASVKEMISSVIKKCKLRNKYIGICGEAPAKFQEFAEYLVEEEIDSIAMDPEKIIDAIYLINAKEKFLNRVFSRNPEDLVLS